MQIKQILPAIIFYTLGFSFGIIGSVHLGVWSYFSIEATLQLASFMFQASAGCVVVTLVNLLYLWNQSHYNLKEMNRYRRDMRNASIMFIAVIFGVYIFTLIALGLADLLAGLVVKNLTSP